MGMQTGKTWIEGHLGMCQGFKMRNIIITAILILGIYMKGNKGFGNQFSRLQMGIHSLLLLLSRSRVYFPSPLIWTGLVTSFDCKTWPAWCGMSEPHLKRTSSFCFIPLGSQVPFKSTVSETTMLWGSPNLSQAEGEVTWSWKAPNLKIDEQSLSDASGAAQLPAECSLSNYQMMPCGKLPRQGLPKPLILKSWESLLF